MSGSQIEDLLAHLRRAAHDVASFVEGSTKEAFFEDKRTQQAVVLSLLVIGETATRIMTQHAAYAANRSDIPWQSMRGMRNRIAHGYYEMDLGVVWETTQTSIPLLLARLGSIPPDGS